MTIAHIAHIALGANLASPAGSPEETLNAAVLRLGSLGQIVAQSSHYQTEPMGYADQPEFVNAAIALETSLEPEVLLQGLLVIEREFGRDRSHGIENGPRTLDLDLLLYGSLVYSSETLQLPHPRMAERSFVLLPLTEIAPDVIHPVLQQSMSQLLRQLPTV